MGYVAARYNAVRLEKLRMSTDEKLFNAHENCYSVSEWNELAEHVLRRLELVLSQSVTVFDLDCDSDPATAGFACSIESKTSMGGILQFEWFGRLGGTVVGNRSGFHCAAWLFPKCCGSRVRPMVGDGAFLYLEYRFGASGTAKWVNVGWEPDIHDEFAHWDSHSWESWKLNSDSDSDSDSGDSGSTLDS